MSTQPTITLQSLLRGLWREIDAEGGTPIGEYERGLCDGIDRALRKLGAAGFAENSSTAADLIDAVCDIADRACEGNA